jgi:hypothetical protein
MIDNIDLVPVTVFLPRRSVTVLATLAGRHGSTAEGEITRLVMRALSAAVKDGRVRDPEPGALRSLESIQLVESIQMLTLHMQGTPISEIAEHFRLSEMDTRNHLLALAENPRAKKRQDPETAAA